MRFLADMGISQSTVNWLRDNGYEAVHLKEEGLQRISDGEIVAKAMKEGRVILTCDLDFGDIMAASSKAWPTVIIFRLENERPQNINRRLLQVLEESFDALEKGAIVSVEETRHRIRFLPV